MARALKFSPVRISAVSLIWIQRGPGNVDELRVRVGQILLRTSPYYYSSLSSRDPLAASGMTSTVLLAHGHKSMLHV